MFEDCGYCVKGSCGMIPTKVFLFGVWIGIGKRERFLLDKILSKER